MDIKKFTMRDEHFVCEVCGREVEPLKYTARIIALFVYRHYMLIIIRGIDYLLVME